jgi:hypothetical protein
MITLRDRLTPAPLRPAGELADYATPGADFPAPGIRPGLECAIRSSLLPLLLSALTRRRRTTVRIHGRRGTGIDQMVGANIYRIVEGPRRTKSETSFTFTLTRHFCASSTGRTLRLSSMRKVSYTRIPECQIVLTFVHLH